MNAHEMELALKRLCLAELTLEMKQQTLCIMLAV